MTPRFTDEQMIAVDNAIDNAFSEGISIGYAQAREAFRLEQQQIERRQEAKAKIRQQVKTLTGIQK